MESLYRKYRPLTFESVVGQQHIVSTLEHAVAEGRLGHAYLFCGPRGTGKTTMARILAKALLCEKSEPARANGASGCMACGTCPECESIAAGTHPDVYELDAASRTGVDNVREEIINSVNFAPVRGAYKVYIVDEVHMLTTQAFNALLKTLEEPPSHVVFVLCTTDPQKLPETILSRCQRFDFHRISNDDIVGRMRYICEQEGFTYDDEALEIVARHARGGMRDALSTLEQLSVFGNGSVLAADARSLLGEVSSTVLAEFAGAIARRDVVELFGLIRSQVDEGNDLMELARDLVGHLRDVYTARLAGAKPGIIDGTPEEIEALIAEAAQFENADRIARTLTVLDNAALEMRNASDTRLVLEIACTRLARPEADLTIEALAERLARLEAQVAAGVSSAPMGSMPGAAPVTGVAAVSGRGSVPGGTAAGPASSPAPGPATRGGAIAVGMTASGPAAGPATRGGASAPGSLPWERGPHAAPVPAAAPAPAGRPAAGAVAPVAAPAAAAPASAPVSAAAAAPAGAPVSAAVPAPAAAAAPAAAPVSVTAAVSAASASAPERASASAPASASTAGSSEATADMADLQRKWSAVVKRVTAMKASTTGLFLHARATGDDGSVLTVTLPPKSSFALKMLTRADTQALLTPAVNEVFGTRQLSIVMEGDAAAPAATSAPAPAPAAVPAAAQAQAPAATSAPFPAAAQAPAPAAAPAPAPVSTAAPAVAPAATSAPFPAAAQAQAPAPAAAPAPASAGALDPVENVPFHKASPAETGMPAAHSNEPEPAAPAIDHASGPTVVPEPDVDAQRRAWEEEQVPYDDATIAAYEVDADVAPVELPAAPEPRRASQASPSQVASASDAPAPASASPEQLQASGANAARPTAPASSAPAAPGALPWSTFTPAAEEIPQNEAESKELINSVFGAGVVFKPVE